MRCITTAQRITVNVALLIINQIFCKVTPQISLWRFANKIGTSIVLPLLILVQHCCNNQLSVAVTMNLFPLAVCFAVAVAGFDFRSKSLQPREFEPILTKRESLEMPSRF